MTTASRKDGHFSILGATDWRSYAFFLAGVRAEDRADMKTAESLYVRALAIDGKNIGARMNLGGVLLEENSYENAVEQLGVAKSGAGNDANITKHAVYYSASYRLAAALFSLNKIREAKKELDGLLAAVDKKLAPPKLSGRTEKWMEWIESKLGERVARRVGTWLEQRAQRNHAKDDHLRPFLEQLRPSAVSMQMGLRVALGEKVSPDELKDLDLWKPEAWFQYNLACTYSMLGGARNGEAAALADSLKHLDFALRLRPALCDWAQQDPSLQGVRKGALDAFKQTIKRHKRLAAAT